MKKFTFLTIALLVALLSVNVASAQDEGRLFEDDFSVAHDYLADGTEGTIFDGFMINDTIWGAYGILGEVTSLNTSENEGGLTFAGFNTHWAWGADNGAFLYKTINEAGGDFEVQVKIVGGDFPSLTGLDLVPWFMPGLMAKVEGDTTFTLVQSFDMPVWGAVHGVRDIVPAEGNAQENWISMDENGDTLTIANCPYIKLEKYETTMTGYCSRDGEVWIKIYEVEKPEYAEATIQVGLYHASYEANPATVIFDDFKLTDYSSFVDVDDKNLADLLQVSYSNKVVKVKNSSMTTIDKVELYSITGALVYSSNNQSDSEISIPVEKNGIYILRAQSNGNRFTKKVSVY